MIWEHLPASKGYTSLSVHHQGGWHQCQRCAPEKQIEQPELDCMSWWERPGRRLCSGVRPRRAVFSSPVHRWGVEPLERLCWPVSAHGARAGAVRQEPSEQRRALPGPGGESRLPGVRDTAGPGLRARQYALSLIAVPGW